MARCVTCVKRGFSHFLILFLDNQDRQAYMQSSINTCIYQHCHNRCCAIVGLLRATLKSVEVLRKLLGFQHQTPLPYLP